MAKTVLKKKNKVERISLLSNTSVIEITVETGWRRVECGRGCEGNGCGSKRAGVGVLTMELFCVLAVSVLISWL